MNVGDISTTTRTYLAFPKLAETGIELAGYEETAVALRYIRLPITGLTLLGSACGMPGEGGSLKRAYTLTRFTLGGTTILINTLLVLGLIDIGKHLETWKTFNKYQRLASYASSAMVHAHSLLTKPDEPRLKKAMNIYEDIGTVTSIALESKPELKLFLKGTSAASSIVKNFVIK